MVRAQLATWQKCCRWALLMVVLIVSLGFPGAIALADGSPSESLPSDINRLTELNATNIPSGKVDQFVSAYLKVAHLLDDRTADLQQADTEIESLQLQRAIETEAFAIIQQAGLSRQDYFQLLGLANTDTEFRDRVLAQLEESIS